MWVVSVYEKHGDRLITEHALQDVDVAELRRLWGRPDDDPMYDSYPVTPEIADELAQRVGESLRTSEFDYFLEYMGGH
jgi:hypothetical protein